ncbi:cytochrome c biogenesis CcdA family protein [Aurantimicrobium sp. MWH-Uga1]|uniref:cytochrome c biogenesis CcdA family protein n=1 Tax=Aurantimicrobium sp. MWH-Uga1 TaxID=2079575 RepID=UPI000DEDE6CF|nr:cytochrome c biogenesis protein CcdA [Aurantimicrobium sp. MWH-Uga1]AXE55204.1 Thiol:disulfide interchange protein DsbD [Aurantimicrobium sp. MWH-Uga1]
MQNVGELVYSGQLLIAIPLAILAGLISFASPCVLPLVPGYLAYVSGVSAPARDAKTRRANMWRMVAGVSLFIAGFSAVFIAYGAAFGAVGAWLLQWQELITVILGTVVIAMGLIFIGQFGFFQRTAKLNISPATGLAGAPLLGVVFGLGWTPCIGPTLTAILSLSIDTASPWRGALLGFAYCVGLGIPFILLAFGLSWAIGSVAFLKRHIRAINIFGGILLIVLGVLMVTGLWTQWIYQLQAVISNFVPTI